ncbi:MAG: hypothetical protein DWQ18_03250 [Crenarchaeota archaeon]|nr:MAG: hypothetical protein DWQ17_05275 [Thermoproteota archaeon]RDJ33939.1 MAG: hypothetical protein DWQ18_03250 [Thermoproteota archaeon]RDJ36948.1 MAG: hypothetical protein DWQ13_07365 [Thermoproteota archaeon]RDJ37517.1 MAG: hypothetical protein DWQ19_03470 [Thermoproteota archaeon]
MDKMLIGSGTALLGLGAGFFAAGAFDPNLISAFQTGGVLWLVIGGITAGLGLKARKTKIAKLDAMR